MQYIYIYIYYWIIFPLFILFSPLDYSHIPHMFSGPYEASSSDTVSCLRWELSLLVKRGGYLLYLCKAFTSWIVGGKDILQIQSMEGRRARPTKEGRGRRDVILTLLRIHLPKVVEGEGEKPIRGGFFGNMDQPTN